MAFIFYYIIDLWLSHALKRNDPMTVCS